MIKKNYIKECIERNGEYYNYELIPEEFKGTDKIPLICPKHGVFYTIARNHKNLNSGCPVCGRIKANFKTRITLEEFKQRAKCVHKKDIYEIVDKSYVKVSDKVEVKCKICGNVFKIRGSDFLKGRGCPICHPFPKKYTVEEFKKKLKELMPNLEVVSEYNGSEEPIYVHCKIHNYKFKTTPKRLISGNNCQKCYDDRRSIVQRKDINVLLDELSKINDYEYPNIFEEYENNKSKITSVCKIHGEFKAAANKLLRGASCPKCEQSMFENYIEHILYDNNINFDYEKRFEWLKGIKNGLSSLDFYLPNYNIAIECQGEQHFTKSLYIRSKYSFEDRVANDILKYNLCKEHGIPLIYILPKKMMKYSKLPIFKSIYSCNVLIYEEVLKDPNILLNHVK